MPNGRHGIKLLPKLQNSGGLQEHKPPKHFVTLSMLKKEGKPRGSCMGLQKLERGGRPSWNKLCLIPAPTCTPTQCSTHTLPLPEPASFHHAGIGRKAIPAFFGPLRAGGEGQGQRWIHSGRKEGSGFTWQALGF